MKKTILLLTATLITISSFSQTNKDSIPKTKTEKPQPLTQFPVTLSISEWEIVLNALNELPAKTSNPVMDKIKQTYSILTSPKQKP